MSLKAKPFPAFTTLSGGFWGGRIRAALLFCGCLLSVPASAATILSYTGTLSSPNVDPGDQVIITFTLSGPGDVTLQTYGFGGGTNGNGSVIAAGGFDPFVGLFSGTGPTAVLIDGTADNLSNYTSEPNACGPAGLVTIGSIANQCGDVRLQFTGLAAGDYTILLTDANYTPNAIYGSPGYLGDGFTDFTNGAFTTCYDEANCKTDTANWALDFSTTATVTPEPATSGLVGIGLALAIGFARRKKA
jgi:PEP-CTERM motif